MIFNRSIKEFIQDEMKKRGITQKQLAELLGVSPSRIIEYMTGRAEPTLRVARLLHKILDIDADFLLG
jgi:HTH-type transcriptional regulator/antitoxin HigA